MDQSGLQPMGPGGRKLHIAHRRSPSELTPLMSKLIAHEDNNLADADYLSSGAASTPAADRCSATAAATNRSDSPAIRQHGHDFTSATACQ